MTESFFTFVSSATIQLLSANSGFFLAEGVIIYTALALLALITAGLANLFPREFAPVPLGRLYLTLIGTALLLHYYTAPAPFIGVGLHRVPTIYAKQLSQQLENGTNQQLQVRMVKVFAQLEIPGWRLKDIAAWLYYFACVMAIQAMKIVLLVVVGVGYIAVAVAALTGPLFIPWRIFPGTAWLFQAWLRSFLGFCYYQVVASATVYVCSTFLTKFFDQNPGPYTLEKLATILFEMVAFVLASVFILFIVPAVSASLMLGKSGDSGFRI